MVSEINLFVAQESLFSKSETDAVGDLWGPLPALMIHRVIVSPSQKVVLHLVGLHGESEVTIGAPAPQKPDFEVNRDFGKLKHSDHISVCLCMLLIS